MVSATSDVYSADLTIGLDDVEGDDTVRRANHGHLSTLVHEGATEANLEREN